MTHSAEHHIEHAEHAAHAIGDRFNKQVTMSIAIVAAVLACVTMLGHRAHNDTLLAQGQALKLQNEASNSSTEAANKWAYYQTKNTFNFLSGMMVDTLEVVVVREEAKKDFDKTLKSYKDTIEYYGGDPKYRATKTKKGKKPGDGENAKPNDGHGNEAKKNGGHDADPKHKPKGDGDDKAPEKKPGELGKAMDDALKAERRTKELQEASEKKIEESHELHKKTYWLDSGELGLQFGVVLCSLAILTRGRSLWFMGLLSAVVGAVVAAIGQFGWFSVFMGQAHH
jgi:Domain of unknown function (DUF4337)